MKQNKNNCHQFFPKIPINKLKITLIIGEFIHSIDESCSLIFPSFYDQNFEINYKF